MNNGITMEDWELRDIIFKIRKQISLNDEQNIIPDCTEIDNFLSIFKRKEV